MFVLGETCSFCCFLSDQLNGSICRSQEAKRQFQNVWFWEFLSLFYGLKRKPLVVPRAPEMEAKVGFEASRRDLRTPAASAPPRQEQPDPCWPAGACGFGALLKSTSAVPWRSLGPDGSGCSARPPLESAPLTLKSAPKSHLFLKKALIKTQILLPNACCEAVLVRVFSL